MEKLQETMMESLPTLRSQDLPVLDISSDELNLVEFVNDDPVKEMQNLLDHVEDVTLDVAAAQMCQFVPVSPRGPPPRIFFPGPANFSVEVASTHVHKKKFLYSYKVHRIYVDKDCDFSVSFNWDMNHTPAEMYVRATVVFSDVEQSEKRVERCLQHYHEALPKGLPDQIARSVLHSSRDINTQGVYYCGAESPADSWYSVLVYFNKTSSEPCTHAYKFACKSSCASGINRRGIAIIFTLEGPSGEVFGRQMVGVKVCACPRRDMQRDEEAGDVCKETKRRVPNTLTKTKKIKLETQDVPSDMVMLPQICVEVNALVSGLRTMVDNMTNVSQHSPELVEHYAKSIAELKAFIKSMEQSPPT